MADDLVKRLREKADRKTPNLHMEIKRIETEAADRIEQLEAALREVKPRIKRTIWLNVHVNRSVVAHNYREEADNLFCKDVAPRIACIKVDLDFEEGEGL